MTRSTTNGSGPGDGLGPLMLAVDGTPLNPEHWWLR